MSRYTLLDFISIFENGIDNTIPEETIQIINMLANHVGSPEYIKTPQFKTNKTNYTGGGNGNGNGGNGCGGIRRKKKPLEVHDNDWETIRSFQTTELKKNEGVDNNLHVIRKYLNMITENTYAKLKDNIILEINTVISMNNDDDLNYLCNEIFKIVSSNILYSDIYAKLYKDLIGQFSIFNDILIKNFSNFEEIFNTIEYYDPESHYDKFCENNKKNEIRRALCSFYVNLMKEEIIDNKIIGNIILNLFKQLDNMISVKNKKNELDELSELIYIMVINSYEIFNINNNDLYKEIYDNIVRITNMKSKNTPGITNKCIFKHMDILDEIS